MRKILLCTVFSFILMNACKKEEEIDPCNGINCLNGGQCNDGSCVCPTGWTGEFCQTSTDPCANISCLNGGVCNTGTCTCPPGWTGEFCQTSTNLCDNVNCLNGGVCNDGTCTCPPGWTGEFCQTAVNPCDTVTCLNGGTCIGGTCNCPPGWTGEFCQTAVNPCDTVTCLNGGTCIGGTCDCPPGYSGIHCQTLDRDKFLGIYQVSDNCATAPYTSEVVVSLTGLDKIILREFGKYLCNSAAPDVIATVNGSSLTISLQTFCPGNEFTIVGNGSISLTTITINYTTEHNGNVSNCTAVMTLL